MADEPYTPARWDDQWGPIDAPGGGYPEIRWAVEAWNDAGGATFVGGPWGQTLEGAIQRAEAFKIHGDFEGKLYDHVAVVRQVYRTCIKTTHFDLDEARQML